MLPRPQTNAFETTRGRASRARHCLAASSVTCSQAGEPEHGRYATGPEWSGMDLVVVILIGAGIGTMVELLLPGHHATELMLAMLLGVMGALLARYMGRIMGWYG